MAVSFSLQDVMHEGTMVVSSQWDLFVAQFLLQAGVEEAEQELIGQTGRTGNLVLILYN